MQYTRNLLNVKKEYMRTLVGRCQQSTNWKTKKMFWRQVRRKGEGRNDKVYRIREGDEVIVKRREKVKMKRGILMP